MEICIYWDNWVRKEFAAKKLGKNYIGIDSNERYVKIAERRLKEIDKEIESGLFKKPKGKQESFQLEFQVV